MPWKEVSIMSQRLEFVTLATAENANLRHLCRCFGISPGTAYKWLDRFQAAGANGLEDRSRQPHHSPLRTSTEMEETITKLRCKHPAWGGRKLGKRLRDLGHAGVADGLQRRIQTASGSLLSADHSGRPFPLCCSPGGLRQKHQKHYANSYDPGLSPLWLARLDYL